MEIHRTAVFVAFTSIFINQSLMAQTYCVDDVNGSDTNNSGICNGTVTQPWKTLKKVANYSAGAGFQPGDKILFKRGGTYTNTLGATFINSGNSQPGGHIEFGAYDEIGEKPIIQFAGQELVNKPGNKWTWLDQGNGVWLYTYPGTTVNGLWKNGTYLKVASNSALLDGDFYWESGTGIYYRPEAGDTVPSDDNLFRGGTGYGFGVSGLSYLKFKDLHFAVGPTAIGGVGSSSSPIHNITIENCEFENFTTAIQLASDNGQENHDITIENNKFTSNARGVSITSNNGTEKNINITVKKNVFIDTDSNGNYEQFHESLIGGLDIETIGVQNLNSSLITDNEIHTGAREGAIILWTNQSSVSNDNIISKNIIHDITGSGIILFGSNIPDAHTGNSVYFNKIYNCPDSGAIRLSGLDSPESNYITHNTIVNCGTSIYMNALSGGFLIESNISINPTTKHILLLGNEMNSKLNNNIYCPDITNGFSYQHHDVTNLAAWQLQTGEDLDSMTCSTN